MFLMHFSLDSNHQSTKNMNNDASKTNQKTLLLDLSAAFDTVDQNRLNNRLGM